MRQLLYVVGCVLWVAFHQGVLRGVIFDTFANRADPHGSSAVIGILSAVTLVLVPVLAIRWDVKRRRAADKPDV